MRCGCLGLLQWLQLCRPGDFSFQCVRRFLPRVLECSRLGTAIGALLLLRAGVRAGRPSSGPASAWPGVEVGAAARAEPAAVLPATGGHGDLEQQRLASLL